MMNVDISTVVQLRICIRIRLFSIPEIHKWIQNLSL